MSTLNEVSVRLNVSVQHECAQLLQDKHEAIILVELLVCRTAVITPVYPKLRVTRSLSRPTFRMGLLEMMVFFFLRKGLVREAARKALEASAVPISKANMARLVER